MSWSEYRNVYWNSVNQRIWRTTTSAGDVDINYKLVGTMTDAEYNILLEVLFEVFEYLHQPVFNFNFPISLPISLQFTPSGHG